MASPVPTLADRRIVARTALLSVGLIVLTWLAYLPALHGGPVWDDRYMLTQSPTLAGPHALRKIWFDLRAVPVYYPLTSTVLWLQRQVWGVADLTGYHAVNVLLHATNALLVWRLLARLGLRGAGWAAALFAVHPIMVESVAWITELKNTLSGFFALLTTAVFLRKPSSWPAAIAAVGLFALSMFAKTAGVGLPIVLLTLLWWKRCRPSRPQWIAAAAMLVIGLSMGSVTRWVEANVVGADSVVLNRSLLQRLSITGPAVVFYLGKLIWPTHLALLYRQWTLPGRLNGQHAVGLAVVTTPVLLWAVQSKIGRGPCAAALIFLILLAPVLGPFRIYFQQYSFVANHFVYLAAIPIVALLAAGLARLRAWAIPTGIVGVAALACVTWQDSHDYTSNRAAFQRVIVEDPANWGGNNNYGNELLSQHRDDEAYVYFRRSVQTNPEAGEVWMNLGFIAERHGRVDEALTDYRHAVDLRGKDARAHYNLANMLLVTHGSLDEAIDHYHASLLLNPNWPQAHDNLGVALLRAGDRGDAAAEFRAALSLDPEFDHARRHLLQLTPATQTAH